MTDLQIGLAVIGALAVAAVLFYNRWQERGVRREAERAFGSGHADVLMDERREPLLEPRRPQVAPGAISAGGIDYVIQVIPREPPPAAAGREARAPVESPFAGGEPRASYEAMARAGRSLAQARGGRLVDDTGRELDERALAAIGTQLDAVRARLAGCGIEPGSSLALRVFS